MALRRARFGAVPLLLLASSCAGPIAVGSQWTSRPVTIDGRGDEWAEVELFHPQDADISCGVMNDRDHLYLLISTWDAGLIRAIHNEGLVIWLDPSGGRRKERGLRLRGGAANEGASPLSAAQPAELSLLDHKTERLIDQATEAAPRSAEARSEDTWVYEVSIPRGGGPGALVARGPAGDQLDVGLELMAPARRGGHGGRGAGPSGGGHHGGAWGGSYGGHGRSWSPSGGSGGDRGVSSQRAPERVEVWLRVSMVPSPSATEAGQPASPAARAPTGASPTVPPGTPSAPAL
jgi:hypothetical protein